MPHTCTRCSRISPADAVYCYFDGAVLGTLGARGGPVNVGAQPFPTPFVFPTGQKCLNFDQLALTCQNNWQAALEVLSKGYLESFLGGMGRSDLANAAREAARFPDRDRGLDQFLAKLPSEVVKAPLLGVEPTEVNLGRVKAGEDRTIDVRLENKGMRLIYGSLASDSLWLAVGARGNANQKLFQFGDTLTIPVRLRGKHLQARNKPQVGQLTVDTNAGKVNVQVKLEVAVKPYPDGPFAGAKSPREIAQIVDQVTKAKDRNKQKEVATLFESGAVARWYRENNWTYPVQGPAASGIGAIQQFFEALGLMAPPKVTISERSLSLRGDVGGSLTHSLELRTEEKRPIYAHGVSDQPWLEVQRAQLSGRTATIPLVVHKVPERPGETLRANVTIKTNGNQRFVVPVSLAVGGAAPAPGFDFATTAQFTGGSTAMTPIISTPRPTRRRFLHLLPAAALAFGLVDVLAYDLMFTNGGERAPGTRDPFGDGTEPAIDIDPKVRLGVSFNERQRFGFVTLDEKDPTNPQKFKKLTYMEDGSFNNTCVRVDGDEHLYGQAPGDWARDEKRRRLDGLVLIPKRKWISAWEYPGKVRVTQTVMVVPNEDTSPARLDTALVHYLVENRDNVPHTVGLRIMLDTYIGGNDGVPFALPGRTDLVTTKIDLRDTKQIPEFIQALEHQNLADPGTVATMVLKFPSEFRMNSNDPPLDPIVRLLICRFPGNPEVRWDFTGPPMNAFWDMNDKARGENNDSCVTLYWPEVVMPARTKRAMAFTYGLGRVRSFGSASQLALSVPAKSVVPGEPFTVIAYVKNPGQGQEVTVKLPTGMSLADGQPETQSVARTKTEIGQVSWRVKAAKDARPDIYTISARMTGAKASVKVPVRRSPTGILFR